MNKLVKRKLSMIPWSRQGTEFKVKFLFGVFRSLSVFLMVERNRPTERLTDWQTDRQTERQTDRKTDG